MGDKFQHFNNGPWYTGMYMYEGRILSLKTEE